MRPAQYFTLVALMSASAFAQTAPVVSNVHASQRGDGSRMVDIYYNLAASTVCTVWVAITDDGGQSWGVPIRTLTGAFGNGISAGQNKLITWDAAADIPGVLGNFRARVYADDGSAQGNMVFVAAGTYPYQNGAPLYVASFWIDKYEVTNQRYAEFLNDADPNGDHWSSSMEITRTGSAPNIFYAVLPARQNYPIRYVSALDADAYAAWLSGREGRTYRLPTAPEWEKAAAWDPTISKHWTYGFQSDQVSCASCNYGNPCSGPMVPCIGGPTEVGHYNGTNGTTDARSFYGCYDMSGNVSEWTRSGWISAPTTEVRVYKGGSWDGDGVGTLCECSGCYFCSGNLCGVSSERHPHRGFRVVLDPN